MSAREPKETSEQPSTYIVEPECLETLGCHDLSNELKFVLQGSLPKNYDFNGYDPLFCERIDEKVFWVAAIPKEV